MDSINSIIKNIKQYTSKDIFPSIYEGSGKDWTTVIDASIAPSPHYNWLSVLYQNAYFSSVDMYQSLPIILHSKGKPIAIFPIAVITDNEISKIVSAGAPIYEPLMVKQTTEKQKKAIIDICERIISDLSLALNIKSNMYQVSSTTKGITTWGANLLMDGKVHRVGHLLDVNLNTSLEEIKSHFRKSYKPLINKGLKKWDVDVIEEVGTEPFWEFKALHRAVAGRDTRCLESWNTQLDMLHNGEAFLVTLRDECREMVGAGFFVFNSQCGLYGSAAYRRDLFAEPLGHVVQYKAIEVMISKGLKRYEIGYGFSEHYGSTPKECSITKFKSGFCTEIGAIMHIEKQVG